MLPGPGRSRKKGVQRGGDELLADRQNHPGCDLYVRILTRLRAAAGGLAVLTQRLRELPHPCRFSGNRSPAGIAGVTDSQWRERIP